MDIRSRAKPILQLLAALAVLALLAAAFATSPIRQPVMRQLQTLNSMRGGEIKARSSGASVAQSGRAASGKASVQPVIHADPSGGFYDRPVKITLTGSSGTAVFYTLDGSMPSETSSRYVAPIPIRRTAVLSFAAPGAAPQTRTYLIGEPGGMPVLSLTAQPDFLWNRHAGIYLNPSKRGSGWRRPAQVEYFADQESPPLRFPVQMQIHGNWSRVAAKKSFELNEVTGAVAADRDGLIAAPANNGAPRALVARATAMDVSYRFGEELFRDVYGRSGGTMTRAVLVRLLLNGAAWGLYNLHEKIDQEFLRRRHGAGEYELVDGPGYRRSRGGGNWNRMLDFFMTADLREAGNFEKGRRLIDVENFTDYWLFNIYAANFDWPQSNYYAYRKRAPDEPWRWLSWDTDAAFDVRARHHDTLAWATRAELRHDLSYNGDDIDFTQWLISTAIVRALLKNHGYRDRFVHRFCALHHDYFRPNLLQVRFQAIVDRMTPYLDADWQRWPDSKQAYHKGVQGVRRFIDERPAVVLEQFRKRFGFTDCP